MIKWYPNLYTDKKVEKNKFKCMQSLEKGKITLGLYCIAIASNRENLFDIINTNELLFKHYQKNEIHIVGLAYGKDNAVSLVTRIIMDMYQQFGEINTKSYFMFD